MTGELLNGRYKIGDKLGAGGMAEVYRALDLQTGQVVALKVIRSRLERSSQKRFAREFQAISSVKHPHCIRVLDFGETPDCLFFTMELFCAEWITSLHGQPLPTILRALYQTAEALEHVHGQGIVHRDVKPSNLLVRLESAGPGVDAEVEVKLTDFGLARFSGFPSSVSTDSGFLGTVQYCAPEQFGSGVIDHRADLHSLGLVCYETLTGRYPFEAALRADMETLIHAKVWERIPDIRTVMPELPGEVAEVVMKLLARDPGERPESAGVLKASVSTSIGRRKDPVIRPTTVASMEGAFVGRDKELAVLHRCIHAALSPHAQRSTEPKSSVASALFITGDAGIGKSHLLREVGRIAQRRGSNVYDGRCFQGTLIPYQPFVDILREVVVEGRSRKVGAIEAPLIPSSSLGSGGSATVVDTEVNQLTGEATTISLPECAPGFFVDEFSAEILAIAPDLRRWLPGNAFKQVDPSRETHYILRAVSSFFVEMATLHGTTLLIEDLQWADQSTLDLLYHTITSAHRRRELGREKKATVPRLFICCTLRHGESNVSALVRGLQHEGIVSTLDLRPFSGQEVRELIGLLLATGPGELPDSLVEPLRQRSAGNPFFLSQMVRTWQSDGRIARSEGQWVVKMSSAVESASLPDSIRQLMQSRVSALTDAAKEILSLSSVIGTIVDLSVLHQAFASMPQHTFLRAVEELLSHRIFVDGPTEMKVEFAHDLIRELAYQELSSVRRAAAHRQIGEMLESQQQRGIAIAPDTLAYHFSKAGVLDKAVTYLLNAGAAALQRYATDDALRSLTQANELIVRTNATESQSRLHHLLAAAYATSGRPIEAVKYHERSLQEESDLFARSRILERMGELYFRVGDFEKSLQSLEQGLRELGLGYPRWIPGVIARAAIDFARYILPNFCVRHRKIEPEGVKRRVAAARIYYHLTFLLGQRSLVRTLQANIRQLVLAREIGDAAMLADTYGRHAIYLGLFSFHGMARRVSSKTSMYSRQSGDPLVQAVAQGVLGCTQYYAANLPEAESHLRQSLAVIDRRGDSWYRMFFYHNLRHLYSITGDIEKELSAATTELQIGEAVGDQEGTYYAEYGLANALARAGKTDQALAFMAKVESRILQPNILAVPTALQTYGFVHLQSSNYQAAEAVLRKSRSIVEKNFAFADYAIRVYPLLAESLLGPHWDHASKHPSAAKLREGCRISRIAVFWGRRFPNYLSHALRVRGRALFVQGRRRKAIHYLSQAIETAERLGAQYDLARSHIDLAKIGEKQPEFHWTRGIELLRKIGATLPEAERLG